MNFPPNTAKVTPWSFSSLNDFETCNLRYYLTRVAKVVKEKQSPEMLEGNKRHKALELYVGGKAPLPTEYAGDRPMADKIKAAPGQKLLEYAFGLNKALQPVGFWAKDVWVRGKLDVAVVRQRTALVLDYKTGKRKKTLDQLKMFAGATFREFPYLEKVTTGYAWLPIGKIDTEVFKKEDEPAIWQEFAIRVHRMEDASRTGVFRPNPSGLCRAHCPVGKSNCSQCGT